MSLQFDSRRRFMDKELLIGEIYKRNVLWDINCVDYNKRDKCKKAWEEVAQITDSNCYTAKKIWRQLRDNYRAEMKKLKDNDFKSQGPKWMYFKHMHFLHDVLDLGPTREKTSSTKTFPSSEIKENESKQRSNLQFKLMSNNQQDIISKDFSNMNEGIKGKAPKTQTVLKKQKTKESKKIRDDFMKSYRAEKLAILREDNKMKNDADYKFLLSFLPHMKKLNEVNNMKLRHQLTKLFMQIKESEESKNDPNKVNLSPPEPACSPWLQREDHFVYDVDDKEVFTLVDSSAADTLGRITSI